MTDDVLGAAAVWLAAFLGGATGFGYGLLATPLLLAIGFELPLVVTANLALSLLTRISVMVRLRSSIRSGPTATLVLASVPGVLIGAELLVRVDPAWTKAAAGVVAMAAAMALYAVLDRAPPAPFRGATAVAGFLGGALGGATSLNGVFPVLLLARARVPARTFMADMATYFVVGNAITLAILELTGAFDDDALARLLIWLPFSVLGNWLGIIVGTRVSASLFHLLVLMVVFSAGLATFVLAISVAQPS